MLMSMMFVVAAQMENMSGKMLLIFEMEGVLFTSYTRDEPNCPTQRIPDWEFGDKSYF